jgi:hypothetical protein
VLNVDKERPTPFLSIIGINLEKLELQLLRLVRSDGRNSGYVGRAPWLETAWWQTENGFETPPVPKTSLSQGKQATGSRWEPGEKNLGHLIMKMVIRDQL